MRELTIDETFAISGATTTGNDVMFFIGDHLASAILSGVAAAVAGGAIGYLHGGDAMGVFGLGFIGQMVGAIGGALIGGVGGVIGGSLVSLSYSLPLANLLAETIISGAYGDNFMANIAEGAVCAIGGAVIGAWTLAILGGRGAISSDLIGIGGGFYRAVRHDRRSDNRRTGRRCLWHLCWLR
ncbi:hypothetical protein FD733_16050 [Pantoea sp. Eser]|nr:hypothetical protein [Pantoea sp. Eser]